MKQGKRWGKMITAQKMKFFVKDFFSKCNQIAENCEFFTFTEEILNGKHHFLCIELWICQEYLDKHLPNITD